MNSSTSPVSHPERKLRQAVQSCLASCRALDNDFRVVLGLSGGPDSLALLHVLLDGLLPAARIVAAHLNHRLRAVADGEAAQVAQICRSWGVECRMGVVDVKALAKDRRLSLEDAARRARYQFLAQTAVDCAVPVVAVGHHADDQAETVLLHFLRGSGLGGLRGMSPIGKLPSAPHIVLLRPLLQVDRVDIIAYCAAHGLQPLVDESNYDTSLLRNRVRHELLPLLESYNPAIRRVLQNQATLLSGDFELLDSMLRETWGPLMLGAGNGWLRLDLPAWRALPLSLRRAAIRRAIVQIRGRLDDAGFQTIEGARLILEEGEVGAQASLPGGLVLTLGYGEWLVAAPDASAPAAAVPQVNEEGPLSVPGRFPLADGWAVTSEYLDDVALQELFSNPDRWVAHVSADGPEPLHIRKRKAGETFQPLGMAGHSASLKAYMINSKLPVALRERWPIVSSERHLVWLVGHRIDERARCLAGNRVIRLTCRRE